MHMMPIFTQSHIPHVMRATLNRPVPAPELFEQRGTRLGQRQVRDPITDGLRGFPAAKRVPRTGALQQQGRGGPGQIGALPRGAGQAAAVQAPMPFPVGGHLIPLFPIGGDRGQGKKLGQVIAQAHLISFDQHQVGAALVGNLLREGALGQ